MALTYPIIVKANNANAYSNTILYYEKNTIGVFDGEFTATDSSTQTTLESALNNFSVVVVPTGSIYREAYWESAASYATITDFGLVSRKASSAATSGYCQFAVEYGNSNVTVKVIDEHGSHTGAPTSSTGIAHPTNQYIGLKHISGSEDDSYVYKGVKVTLQYSSTATFVSSGGTTEGLVTTYSSDYDGAIVFKCGNLGIVTVEFLYEAAPVEKDVSWMSDSSTVFATTTCTTGTDYILPDTQPTKEGNLFLGWFTEETGGTEVTATTEFTQDSPTTIYAQWEEAPVGTYVITLNGNGGTFSDGTTSHEDSVVKGEKYKFSTTPTYEGHTFSKWKGDDASYIVGEEFTPTSDASFLAIWAGSPSPRPEEEKDHMVRSSSSDYLIYGSGGALIYAV